MKLRSLFGLLFAVVAVHAALAATTTSRLITNTSDHENVPQIGGSFVAFQRAAFVGAPTGVVLYDLQGDSEIDLGTGELPQTDGATVVWSAKSPHGDYDVHVYDIATGVETVLELPDDQLQPHVDGELLTFDDATGSDTDVVVHHLPSGAETRVGYDMAPEFMNDLDGNRVAYISSATGNLDIWVFDFVVEEAPGEPTAISGVSRQITRDPSQQSAPALDGDIVVFTDQSSGDSDVRYVDLSVIDGAVENGVLVGSGPGHQRLSDVSGGRIVYTDEAAAGGAVVYVYDVATATGAPLAVTTPGNEFSPSIDGSLIAYEARGTTSSDIGVADLGSEEEFRFGGLLPPVDGFPTFNSLKAGAAVAVKFSLGGFRGLDIFAAGYPSSQVTPCEANQLEDAIEETVAAGNSSLTYEPDLDEYTYVWKTNKAWSGTCRQLVLLFSDGSEARANFRFLR
jgi:beta propeller repeat protein